MPCIGFVFLLLCLVFVRCNPTPPTNQASSKKVDQQPEIPAKRDSLALALSKKMQMAYEADLPPDSTLAYALAAVAQAEKAQDWRTWGEAQTYVLAAYYGLNKFAEAAETFPQLEQTAFARIPNDSTFWSDYYNTAGAIYFGLGNYENALKYGLKELAFYEKIGNKPETAIASNNIGTYYRDRGDYDRALEYTLSALQMFSSLPDIDPSDILWTYDNISKIWLRKKNYENAISYAEKGLSILKKQCPDQYEREINFYLDQANAYIELEEFPQVLEALNHARQLQEFHHSRFGIADTWLNLGFVYCMTNQYALAESNLKKAIDAFGSGHPFLGKTCRYFGLLYQFQGQYRKALEWQQKGLRLMAGLEPTSDLISNPDMQHVNVYNDYVRALMEKGETLKKISITESDPVMLEAALNTYDYATQVLDTMRNLYQEGSKAYWNLETRPILENAISIALQLHKQSGNEDYIHQAFRYAEKGKAYLLTEALRESAAKQESGIPEELLAEEKHLNIEIAFYKKLIYQEQQKQTPDASRMLLCQSEILQRRRANESLMVKLERNYPEYYQIKYRQIIPDIPMLQKSLPDHAGLLEYFQSDSAIYAFYVSPNSVKAVQCASDDDLFQLLDGLRNQKRVAEQGRSKAAIHDFAHQAASLYQMLIAPVLSEIPEQLIIIPDGQLAYLPFELLLTQDISEDANATYASLPYLLQKTTVRYEYSALLAFQKPVKKHCNRFFEGYAPIYGKKLMAEALRGAGHGCREWNASDFVNLANNQPEVSAIAEITGGSAILGPDATEASFREKAPGSRILHLSMHGFLNDCDPAYSGLVFAPDNKDMDQEADQEANDGILHAYEVYNLRLNADLAVLSACNTGRGKLAKGEGIISMARAFKYAGCNNVLMSLWQADDLSTREIMTGFYERLKKGDGKAAALRQAKLDYLAASPRTHPFFWGAFILIGDNTELQSENHWYWYGGAIVLVLAIFLIYQERKKKH
ncbi:MAG: CHAT domain-containing protein [Lewinellaceae bacterium]|nr:CHAT domain-containing protein [Saprospiraceae bacterium]MCB9345308.1 CHAT domain-containing protein [Lewinellaceae bacterium]